MSLIDALEEMDDEERKAIRLCSLYEQTGDLETFCLLLELDPTDEDAVALFDTVHENYVEIWSHYGEELFTAIMSVQPRAQVIAAEMLNVNHL